MMAVLSVESLSSACVKSLQFADIMFISLVPLWECKSAMRIPKLKASLSVV